MTCDLALDGVPVESFTDRNVVNRVSSPKPVVSLPAVTPITEGDTLTITATASGYDSLQWYLGGSPLGDTGLTISYADAPLSWDGYVFTCVATNACGKTTSNNYVAQVGYALPIFDTDYPTPLDWTVDVARVPLETSGNFGTGGTPTSYSLTNFPSGVSIDNSGLLTGTPDTVGQSLLATINATNAAGTANSNALTINVNAAPTAPVFDGVIADMVLNTGDAMTPYDASIHFKLGDAPTSYSLQNAPAWQSIDNAGEITGTPPSDAVTAGVTVTGTNSAGSTVSNAFSVTSAVAAVTIIHDTFTDNDGVQLWDHTPDIDTFGDGWTSDLVHSTFTINPTNQLKFGSHLVALALIETGASDCVVSSTMLVTGVNINIIVRSVDTANLWIMFHTGTDLTIQEKTSNTWTVRAETAYVLSGQHDIKATCNGDDFLLEEGSNSVAYTSSVRNTITTHGYFAAGGADSVVDNFKVETV